MAWSTRRLAQLGGTTVKTIRHYHEIGLLDEPERAGNGYKQYGTAHLVRVLQIARLRDLGMELAQIAELEVSGEAFAEALHQLDAQLAESISHQQQLRAEIAELIRHRTGHARWIHGGRGHAHPRRSGDGHDQLAALRRSRRAGHEGDRRRPPGCR